MKKILLAVMAFSFFAGIAQAIELPKRGQEPPHRICPVGYYYNGQFCIPVPVRVHEQ